MLFDVRTKEEYDGGHIEGAILHDIMDMMQGIFPSVAKDKAITLYCESGNRSMMAKSMMQQAGFTNVTDGGGMEELKERLIPLEAARARSDPLPLTGLTK